MKKANKKGSRVRFAEHWSLIGFLFCGKKIFLPAGMLVVKHILINCGGDPVVIIVGGNVIGNRQSLE